MHKIALKPIYNFYAAPHPAIIAGTFVDGKPTYNTLGDFGILCAYPLHVYIASVESHFTNLGIRTHGTFSVNIPSTEQLIKTDYVGSVSGHKVDKSLVFDYEVGEVEYAPLIKECPVSIACRVTQSMIVGRNEVFMGKVVAIYANPEVVKDNEINIDLVNPITLFMDGSYRNMGKTVGQCYELGKEYST